MPKRIIFCSDGTWDDPKSATNVYKLYKALRTTASQVPYYDDGVGVTGLPIQHLLGGAFGVGLFQKVRDGYSKIAQVYDQDDEIFLFGFSRGAYTARSLAGMIAICGLPTGNFSQELVEIAFQAYREPANRARLLATLAPDALYNAQIRMVGVWDTVGSLGIPGAVFQLPDPLYGFLDTNLHPDVHNAYQALAVDEKRREFPATLWTGGPAPGQVVDQVWFAGVHGDVGGGYPETNLSDITLRWMLSKAVALGLEVDPDAAELYPPLPVEAKLATGTIHDSWDLAWGLWEHRSIQANATISNSVAVRVAEVAGYRPPNLHIDGTQISNTYGIEEVVENPGMATAT